MAHREKAPYLPQDHREVRQMLQSLESHSQKGKGKGGFSCRKATYVLPSGRDVHSWKMADWDYKKPNLPTYARGLFTGKNLKGEPEIFARGYDKFFNHGEVRKTEWKNVETNTRGPYELSVKENGCIIFIAGMDDDSLLVCSKHSTGDRGDPEKSHSIWGEKWIDRQLQNIGKTRADLARALRAMNATAVAELCDDEFEEHVLEYKPEDSGLYLHGININVPEFVTYPGHLVDQFAQEWGFRKVVYVMENDILQVKTFLDGIAETGAYAGRDTEGFVIRCQARDSANGVWHDWFFKYKFEEPYLMYRQWRECTKAIIAGRQPKYRKHQKITEQYLLYARQRLAKDRNLGKLYNQNHGIIALRDDFLKSQGVTGAEVIRQEIESGEAVKDVTNNVVLVPIATIGCGKTTLALALCKLFGWGHFQNDNVEGAKGRPQRFATAVSMQLANHPVVFADRNNHQKRERAQLIKDLGSILGPSATFVALHFVHDPSNFDAIRQTMRERVLSRGDNHQTIQAGTDSQKVIGIMEGFLSRFEKASPDKEPDSLFDLIIDLDPNVPSRDNLETVVSKLYSEYPKLFLNEMPSATDLDDAIQAALDDYKPDIKHDLSKTFGQNKGDKRNKGRERGLQQQQNGSPSRSKKAVKQPKPIYFSVKLPSDRVRAILAAIFRDKDPQTAQFYCQLENSRRIQPEFHCTLIHSASKPSHPELWSRYNDLHSSIFEPEWAKAQNMGATSPPEPELGKCRVQLERLVWDGRVMAFVVRLLDDEKAKEGENHWETANKVAHVTVGTASDGIKPKESNDLLERWLAMGSGEATGIWEEKIKGFVALEGSVRGVIGR
jgi:tRNA ligase